MPEDLLAIINVQCMAAGSLGGMVHAFRLKKPTTWEVIGYIVTGGIAANFIAPQMLKILTMFPVVFLAFGVGLGGKHICYGLEKFFNRLGVLWKTKNE